MFIIAKTIKTVVAVVLLVGCCWYVFNRFCRTNIYGNGTTIDDIKNELDQVENNQSATEERYYKIEESVNNSITTINTMSDRFEEADRIIKQCESIIDDIQKTATTKN